MLADISGYEYPGQATPFLSALRRFVYPTLDSLGSCLSRLSWFPRELPSRSATTQKERKAHRVEEGRLISTHVARLDAFHSGARLTRVVSCFARLADVTALPPSMELLRS